VIALSSQNRQVLSKNEPRKTYKPAIVQSFSVSVYFSVLQFRVSHGGGLDGTAATTTQLGRLSLYRGRSPDVFPSRRDAKEAIPEKVETDKK